MTENTTQNTISGIALSDEQQHAVDLAEEGKSFCLLGKAGVGKSLVINTIRNGTDKGKMGHFLLLAPTGVAAINISGMTIHRLISDIRSRKEINNGVPVYGIIIDEISMVPAILLDELSETLQKFMMTSEPFGGLQVIMIGDPGQLPPVTDKDPDAKAYQKKTYNSAFFFSAYSYFMLQPEIVALTKIFRQGDDKRYANLLNMIRAGENSKIVAYLNARHRTEKPMGLVLCGTNKAADIINETELNKIKDAPTITSKAIIDILVDGYDFKSSEYPAQEYLNFKVGAKVMVIKNIYRTPDGDIPTEYWQEKILVAANGDTASVLNYHEEKDIIELLIHRSKEILLISKSDGMWTKERPQKDENGKSTGEKETLAVFYQHPLRLGYAVTIHKSQGATISDPFTIDLRTPLFSEGQLYVALSRGTSLSNLHIIGRVRESDVKISKFVVDYLKNGNESSQVGIKTGSKYEQKHKMYLDSKKAEKEMDKMTDEDLDAMLGEMSEKSNDLF